MAVPRPRSARYAWSRSASWRSATERNVMSLFSFVIAVMLRASEIAAPGEVGRDLGSDELVQRDAMPAGRSERATGTVWDLERAFPFPSSRLHGPEGRIEVGHSVDQDG